MEPHAEHFTPHYFDDPLSQYVAAAADMVAACIYECMYFISLLISIRYRHRFFDQVGHKTMYASNENKTFFTK